MSASLVEPLALRPKHLAPLLLQVARRQKMQIHSGELAKISNLFASLLDGPCMKGLRLAKKSATFCSKKHSAVILGEYSGLAAL